MGTLTDARSQFHARQEPMSLVNRQETKGRNQRVSMTCLISRVSGPVSPSMLTCIWRVVCNGSERSNCRRMFSFAKRPTVLSDTVECEAA